MAHSPATTVPYHNIWLSLAVLYGLRMWPVRTALILLAVVATVSGVALVYALDRQNMDEAAEIPMMSMLFLIMVWFAAHRQAAADALARSAARERDFVRDASHQLRTPITVARGHAELIRESSDPLVAADAAIVIGEMERLSRISDRLLIMAAVQEPQLTSRAPVGLGALLEAAARRWEPTAPRAWRVRLDTDGTIVGDAAELEAALDAVIENAITATQDGDEIEIRLRADADVAIVEVSDTGIGIDPRHLERVFDRFWSGHARGQTGGGTGLGLSMVRGIAEVHDGTADARLRPQGGTTIRLRLPGFAHTRVALAA